MNSSVNSAVNRFNEITESLRAVKGTESAKLTEASFVIFQVITNLEQLALKYSSKNDPMLPILAIASAEQGFTALKILVSHLEKSFPTIFQDMQTIIDSTSKRITPGE